MEYAALMAGLPPYLRYNPHLTVTKVRCDFETQSEANLPKCGAWEYSVHKTTRVMCFAVKLSDAPKVFLFDWYFMQTPWAKLPDPFKTSWLAKIHDDHYVFSAHNAYFEQVIYKNILVARLGWPEIAINKWRCNAVKVASHALPRKLGNAAEVLQVSILKDMTGYRVMMKLCKPTKAWKAWNEKRLKNIERESLGRATVELGLEPIKWHTPETDPDDFTVLYRYCKIDVLTEEKIDERLPDLIPYEQINWFIDQELNMRGVRVDMPLVTKIFDIMQAEAKVMAKELDTLTMGLVSSGKSRNQIIAYLDMEGLTVPNLKAGTVEDLLAGGKLSDDQKQLLLLRKALAKASTAKYKKFIEMASSDGRVRDIILFMAASTRRWGGKGVQPQNFPRGVIKDLDAAIYAIQNYDVEDLKMLYGNNLMPLFSSVLRGMFIASEGHEMFVEDYNAIEARVLHWLADNEECLQLFEDGTCLYKTAAAEIFDIPYDEVEDDGDQRQTGKAAELGCGYQMGWKKFIKAAWDVYRVKVSVEIAKKAVQRFRKKHYKVTEFWANCERAFIEAVKDPGTEYTVGKLRFIFKKEIGFLYLYLPSGSFMAYKDPRIFKQMVTLYYENDLGEQMYFDEAGNDVTGKPGPDGFLQAGEPKIRYKFEADKIAYMAQNGLTKKWELEYTYGGKIVENAVQSCARDVLADAARRVRKHGFIPLMHSHDELASEAPKGKFKLDVGKKGLYCPFYRELLETLPAWAEGLPLKASGWVGERYRKG